MNRAVTKDDVPTREELKSILTHCDSGARAMILLGASSGLRIGDILNLDLNQVKNQLKNNPPKLTILQQKTQQEVTVFFSQETAKAISEWIKVRDEYLSYAHFQCSSRGIGEVDLDSDRLFPFQYSKAVSMWNDALQSAGLTAVDSNTKRRVLHIHSLRKYFRTQLGVAGMKPDIAEALLGHTIGLREYIRYTPDEIAKEYLMAEPKLKVFVETVTDDATAIELGTLKQRLEQQQQLIRQLNQGMRNLAMTHSDPEIRKLWEGQLGQ